MIRLPWSKKNRPQRPKQLSPETLQMKRETEAAKRKLDAVSRDDAKIRAQTGRVERLRQENNFGRDVKRALEAR